ncbi:MAG: hypothetical protein IKZ38_03530 [Clostridia bacterium]|nr:hypothetical protein [Clostridia bacterium]
MINLLPLVKTTSAYEIIKRDKEAGRLSHAYMISCFDGDFLAEYLKILARLIACPSVEPCGECRACKLIDKQIHPDVEFYPKEGDAVLVGDVNALIEASFVRPMELNERVFVIINGALMNAQAQNKLLKTLEEPPANVHILIGTTSEYAMLSTVKSRAKKVEISTFSAQTLFNALKESCPEEDRLKSAIACGDGTLGKALALYLDEDLSRATDLCRDILINMKSSRDVLEFSDKIAKSKIDIDRIISVTENLLRDMLTVRVGKPELASSSQAMEDVKNSSGFNSGAIIYALDKICEAKKRKKFNANPTMLTEWLLFTILEGKFKWQKS